MSDIEGVDASDASWPDIVQYVGHVASKSEHMSAYCYLRVPHGLERSARTMIRELGVEDNFTVLHQDEAFPETCSKIITLRAVENKSFFWRAWRSVFPSRLMAAA